MLTWADAHHESLRWSSALERLGVARGEPVVTVFVNTFEAFHSWMGCSWLGAIDSPINTNTTVQLGPLAHMLMHQPERDDDADNPLKSVVLVPLLPNVEEFARRFDLDIFTCFNMTEISCAIIQQHPVTNANHRSCG